MRPRAAERGLGRECLSASTPRRSITRTGIAEMKSKEDEIGDERASRKGGAVDEDGAQKRRMIELVLDARVDGHDLIVE